MSSENPEEVCPSVLRLARGCGVDGQVDSVCGGRRLLFILYFVQRLSVPFHLFVVAKTAGLPIESALGVHATQSVGVFKFGGDWFGDLI